MDDAQLLRYSRHILLDEIGIDGQERINRSRVLVIGAGGLGSAAVLYLGAAGVGHLTVVDNDTVDATNLQRQIAHTTARVGQAKVASAAQAVAALNPNVNVVPLQVRADARLLDVQVAQADVVLDCCDNFATRHAINAACVHHRKPLVSGAAIRFDGQLCVYDLRDKTAACYACVFPKEQVFEEAACATMGVFSPLVGVIGAMQAAEALKLLGGFGGASSGRLLMLDGRTMACHAIRITRQSTCPVCSATTS
jgi:molybdopterin/thiamine biosynthesis adenylyltransferase